MWGKKATLATNINIDGRLRFKDDNWYRRGKEKKGFNVEPVIFAAGSCVPLSGPPAGLLPFPFGCNTPKRLCAVTTYLSR